MFPKNTYSKQISTLIKVNHTHIQKCENEILKLNTKKKQFLEDLNATQEKLDDTIAKKTDFKLNYFKSIKKFTNVEVNYFNNHLAMFDAQIANLQKEKKKIKTQITNVEKDIKKYMDKLKKYTFKNVKYDYLKAHY